MNTLTHELRRSSSARSLLRILSLACLVIGAGAVRAQVNPECYPWRTTVSALPFGDPGIFGYSAEEVCRALIARSGNPQLVNGGTVRVFKTFTGKTGDPNTGGYCNVDRQAFSVATGEPVPSESGPYSLDGVGRQLCQPTDSQACGISNPTDPALGVKTESQVDYAGSGAHPLSLVRNHRSVALTPSNLVAVSAWRHNYNMALELRSHPALGVAALVARRADGRGVVFSQVADNAWRAITTTRDVLSERRDTAGALLGYSYAVSANDSTESYNLAGRLTNITARNGWVTTLAYDAAGRLASVKNHFGRELKFTYDAAGRLAELLPPGALSGAGAGTAASPIRYQYEEAASLGAGVVMSGQLSSVTWQDGSVRRYHYEDNRWPQALTGITDEAGVRWATYAYDSYGRVASSEHVGGTDRFSFAYEGGIGDINRTTITDYTGATPRTLVHTFADINGTRFPSAVTAPCSLCGSTAQATSYNAAGDKTRETAHDGGVTFFTYDAKGRETERATFPASYASATTRPALANATRVVSTKWHATFNLPTQVAEPNKTTVNTYNSKGMLTGQSWTATTDATGGAKFTAVKTGSTYATGWSYSASSLATTIVQKVDAVEARRWAFVYNALGDATKVTSTEAGTSVVANLTSSTAHGMLTQLSAGNGAIARFTYNTRNQLATAQLPDYGATMSYDARALLTEIRFGASSWLHIVYDPAGNPLRLEDSAGQSQLIVGLAEPSGLGPRSQAVAVAAGARMRALLSSLRDPATATKWLPLASAKAQATSTAAVPASILQGMSLTQTQQAALALDIPNLSGGQQCCSTGGAGAGAPQLARDYLATRVTMPIRMMGYAATEISGALADEILIQKSAYKLRKDLCKVGVAEPTYCHHAHHIVAVAAPRAQRGRDVLLSVGISINEACNGVFVPCAQHGRLHTTAYYDRVNLELDGLPVKNRTTVCMKLIAIGASITSGAFP